MKPAVKFIGTGFTAQYGRFNIAVSHAVTLVWNAIPSNKRHFHTDEYEFNLVLGGKGEYYQNGVSYALSAGDLFISDPYVPHEISSIATRDLHVLWLNVYIKTYDSPVSELYEDRLIQEFMRSHQTYIPGQKFLLDYASLLSNTSSNDSLRHFSKQHLIKALFYDFIELANSNKLDFHNSDVYIGIKPFTILNLASNYIMANLNNELPISNIAAAVYTSERNLRHLFRKHYNSTVIDYVNRKKMEYAGQLLSLQVQVQEASAAVGIESPAQFSRMFKRYQGVSPKDYKAMKDRKFLEYVG